MIDSEITCLYDLNGYHAVLSVQRDYENPGNEIYGLAEMFCRIIKDGDYNAEMIIDHLKNEFDCEKDKEDYCEN